MKCMECERFGQLTWKVKVLKTKLAYPREEVDKSDKLAQEFGSNFTLSLILQKLSTSIYRREG